MPFPKVPSNDRRFVGNSNYPISQFLFQPSTQLKISLEHYPCLIEPRGDCRDDWRDDRCQVGAGASACGTSVGPY